MGLLGKFEGRIDPQGRLVIPQKFRDALALGQGLVLARGMDPCIDAYPPQEWEEFKKRFSQFSRFDEAARRVGRHIFSTAFNALADRQGRILLPQDLRQHAGINDEIVIVGHDAYFEIWSPQRWLEEEGKVPDLAAIAQGLERGRG